MFPFVKVWTINSKATSVHTQKVRKNDIDIWGGGGEFKWMASHTLCSVHNINNEPTFGQRRSLFWRQFVLIYQLQLPPGTNHQSIFSRTSPIEICLLTRMKHQTFVFEFQWHTERERVAKTFTMALESWQPCLWTNKNSNRLWGEGRAIKLQESCTTVRVSGVENRERKLKN